MYQPYVGHLEGHSIPMPLPYQPDAFRCQADPINGWRVLVPGHREWWGLGERVPQPKGAGISQLQPHLATGSVGPAGSCPKHLEDVPPFCEILGTLTLCHGFQLKNANHKVRSLINATTQAG